MSIRFRMRENLRGETKRIEVGLHVVSLYATELVIISLK